MSRTRLEIQSKESLKTYNSCDNFIKYMNYKDVTVNISYIYQVLKEYTNQNYIAINNVLREGDFKYHYPKIKFGNWNIKNNNDSSFNINFKLSNAFLNEAGITLSIYWTYHKMIKSLVYALFGGIYIKELDDIPENTVVYRGINTEIPSYWKAGDIIYLPGFISTSLSKEVAESFGTYIFVITLHGKGYKGVERLSYYPNEREVLIAPYSKYVISKISGNYCYLDRY